MATDADALWLEIFAAMVRGGMLPDVARSRVALASGRGETFADTIHARWRAQLHQLVRTPAEPR